MIGYTLSVPVGHTRKSLLPPISHKLVNSQEFLQHAGTKINTINLICQGKNNSINLNITKMQHQLEFDHHD